MVDHMWNQIYEVTGQFPDERERVPERVRRDREHKRPFWILWEPTSRLPPTARFDSLKEAQAVADAMAARYGKRFYVCKAESFSERAPAPVKRGVLR